MSARSLLWLWSSLPAEELWRSAMRMAGALQEADPMRILIVNDDGIYSPGILVLAQVAREFGQVTIVAPDVERSSMGHAVTHSRPLSYRRTAIAGFEAFRVDGTPADCVAVG